ncbi:MAG TPA: hypothetical protein VN282_02515 [Pyrinomonadaceae bacterium]|nr:hypothetical protein [Pyrinomonadaceae bacterium]
MHRTRNLILSSVFGFLLVLLVILQLRCDLLAQIFPRNVELDRSKPVPAKAEVVKAWQKRQDTVRTFRFAWTEQQTHPKGWLSNPRFPQREWQSIPGLLKDRNYTVSKTLAVDGNKMRYSFELDRKEEADGVRVTSPAGDNNGLGEGKHYSYVNVFDGQTGKTSLTSLTNSPSPAVGQVPKSSSNRRRAQNHGAPTASMPPFGGHPEPLSEAF